jgi:ribose/xylose/arabinose/galactoside ABC-type transport system permease subunit
LSYGISRQPAITFQLLDLEDFGLSDDLYIKMNARGKPLTAFETFKARYEHELTGQFSGQTRRIAGHEFPIAEFVARQMDTKWADLFWAHRDKKTHLYDGILMNVFRLTGTGGYLAGNALAVPAGIFAFLGVGFLVGVFNGICAARLRMPSFIVTLATMMFVAGMAVWYTTFHSRSVSISNLPELFRRIGYGTVLGVPIAFLLAVAIALIAHGVLSRTLLGRWLYAVGRNEKAALTSGVPVERVVIAAFVISAICAALAAIIYTSRVETGTPVLAQNLFLDIIGAAVIGGVSLFGGRGTVMAALMGVLFLTVLDKGLQLLGLSLFMVLAVKGSVILLAAVLDVVRQKWSGPR